jgi:predicted ribosome quality control (RQC) complex YloA/Tae2 family protein
MTSAPAPVPDPRPRLLSIVRALRKQRGRLARKVDAIRGDLAEAEKSPEFRRLGEALLAYLNQVPKRASSVKLPDPHDPERTLVIALDSGLNAQGNAARYFKRAAKGERSAIEIRSRLATAESELSALSDLIAEGARLEREPIERDLERDLEIAARHLPPPLRAEVLPLTPRVPVEPPRDEAGEVIHRPAPPRNKKPEVPGRLQPRRLRTEDGWDVLIGRSNEGNDHLTLHMARPEDYWFHVHGAPGSHVVLRRGKGKNEPSKRTLEEVAAWTAFYSQARTAGKVPVIWTLKKYVRKPRGAKPGTVMCEREKSIMARPVEPPKNALADSAPDTSAEPDPGASGE